ncbi:MAG: sugar phosphate isomerase/epimerase [Chloroflexi bacterium]|nr:MAG: sugar phosphate isomerase/epimerase [Chloroflexota bacterium]
MIALSTGSLYTYGLDRVFALAADAGFDGLELMVDHRWDTRHVGYLRRLMDRHGVPILAVHSPFVLSVPGWPRDEPGRIRQSIQLAESVGARVVVAHLPRRLDRFVLESKTARLRLLIPLPWPGQRSYRRWLVDELDEFRASTPVTIAIENMPAWRFLGTRINTCYWNDIESIAQFAQLTMDTTHLGTWGIDPCMAYQVWGARVAHVHLSNFNGAEHRLLNDGHLRLDYLLERLGIEGYDGIITLEFNPASLQAENGERVRENLEESLAFCQQHLTAVHSGFV